jgi:hypothetical protein
MEARGGAYRTMVGKPEGKSPLGNTGVEGRIPKNGSSRIGMEVWTGSVRLRIGAGGWLLCLR